MIKNLTPNQYWLLQHQITAFWHGFGVSNGLMFLKEDTKEIYTTKSGRYMDQPSKSGKTYIKISPEQMQHILLEYIKWLKGYKESWDEFEDHPMGIDSYAKFIEDEAAHPSRLPILEMIELLQD